MTLPIWIKSTRTVRLGEPLPVLVSINTASRDDLIALKGLGPALADAIIEGRPWQSLDDLTQISGIGESLLNALRPHITI